jgi:hypothetical protein
VMMDRVSLFADICMCVDKFLVDGISQGVGMVCNQDIKEGVPFLFCGELILEFRWLT